GLAAKDEGSRASIRPCGPGGRRTGKPDARRSTLAPARPDRLPRNAPDEPGREHGAEARKSRRTRQYRRRLPYRPRTARPRRVGDGQGGAGGRRHGQPHDPRQSQGSRIPACLFARFRGRIHSVNLRRSRRRTTARLRRIDTGHAPGPHLLGALSLRPNRAFALPRPDTGRVSRLSVPRRPKTPLAKSPRRASPCRRPPAPALMTPRGSTDANALRPSSVPRPINTRHAGGADRPFRWAARLRGVRIAGRL